MQTAESPIATPCERCGTFAPLRAAGTKRLCAECLARRRLTMEDGDTTPFALITGTFTLIGRLGWRAPAAAMLLRVPYQFANLFVLPEYTPEWVHYAWLLVAIVSDMAIVRMALDLVEGEHPRFWRAFGQAFRRWPVLLLLTVIVQLGGFIGVFVFLFPGFWILTSFCLATSIATLEGRSVGASLRHSLDRMRGARVHAFWAIFSLSLIGYVLDLGLIWIEDIVYDQMAGSAMSDRAYDMVSYTFAFLWNVTLPALVFLPSHVILAVIYFRRTSFEGEEEEEDGEIAGVGEDARRPDVGSDVAPDGS